MMSLPRTAVAASRQVSQQTARRQLSTAAAKGEPKMHKAKGNWASLKAKRPIDEDDLHVSSHRVLL
jgi:predicted secreted hydrolase